MFRPLDKECLHYHFAEISDTTVPCFQREKDMISPTRESQNERKHLTKTLFNKIYSKITIVHKGVALQRVICGLSALEIFL